MKLFPPKLFFVKPVLGLILLTLATPAFAKDIMVGPLASGDGSGADWNNQASWSSLNPVRGNIYYLASGSYSGKLFNTPSSGTTPITFKKATESNHGTTIGWLTKFGAGQVLFANGGVDFDSDYWVFDGVIGKGSNPSTYGFYFTPPNAGSSIRPVVYNGNHVTISHTAVTCPGPSLDIQQFGFSGNGNSVVTDFTYVNNCQVSFWNQGDDNVISNSYMGTYWSTSANHGVHVEQILRPLFFNNILASCRDNFRNG